MDATGLHITPGLIDCHSHTGINGESMKAAGPARRRSRSKTWSTLTMWTGTANWPGIDRCNQLHGSANPIGGRNSVVKLKWGGDAQDFRMQDAKPGIKFAWVKM